MQIQGANKQELIKINKIQYAGVFHCLRMIVVEEGPTSLFKGVFAGLQRQTIFAGIRIGLYPYVRDFICGDKSPSFYQRILAGLLTGAIGICIASPTDVVKVRLQAQGKMMPGTEIKYKGSLDAL